MGAGAFVTIKDDWIPVLNDFTAGIFFLPGVWSGKISDAVSLAIFLGSDKRVARLRYFTE